MYRTTIDFYTLILYSLTTLNLLISSNRFLGVFFGVDSLEFSIYKSMSPSDAVLNDPSSAGTFMLARLILALGASCQARGTSPLCSLPGASVKPVFLWSQIGLQKNMSLSELSVGTGTQRHLKAKTAKR